MRLLKCTDDGQFSLVEHFGDDIPPYAILSHTWGPDSEEVTFKDLVLGTAARRVAYRKLEFCGKQATQDHLQHFWVDTCCIDKSNSTELNETIISMFRWYHDATRCYVYLSDISVSAYAKGNLDPQETWMPCFRRSRWFTRGWTLQELIAPTSVEFFSVEGVKLSDRKSIAHDLHAITGVDIGALQGNPLGQYSIPERMSWAKGRQTKREEDAAYSLMGIFDVQMTLLYGEGREKALNRLQEKIEKPVPRLKQQVVQQMRKIASLEFKVKHILLQLESKPKELGYPWETGVREDQLKIDDGLGAEYFLPVALCETPKVISFDRLIHALCNANTFSLSSTSSIFGMNPESCQDYGKSSEAIYCSGNGTSDIWSLARTGRTLLKVIGLSK